MVALSARHSLAIKPDVEWRELADETFLVRQSGPGRQIHGLIVARAAGKWPTRTILRFHVGRDTLLSMIAAGHGISLLVRDLVAPSTANVAFLPVPDEPGTTPFSAVWSPRNRDPALLNLLTLAMKMGRPRPKPDSRQSATNSAGMVQPLPVLFAADSIR
ncbi:LysR substrate-binding domain-containing protein [Rhizobium leguminosarum]|uniref:LysR substrate-binding domain-containing protein n=1 Tax=Rhizobium leguminosarum TaxID=384 RepID=UPI0021BC1270|nr:LysR substrate-binding domain-containing protein [Rhizobium leguminosarum]